MGKSKNDFRIAGGFGRLSTKKDSGQYLSTYKIINPASRKPYTKAQILADLLERRKQYPQFAGLLEPWIDELRSRMKTYPNAEFTLQHYANSKERAEAELEKLQYHRLETLTKLLFRPLYQRNLAYGDITVADFVTYHRDALYLGELPDTRSRLLGHLDKTILPKIGDQKLKNLDAARQKKVLCAIDNVLQGAKPTRCQTVRRAYRGLLRAIEESGWMGCTAGMRLVDLIGATQKRNSGICHSGRVDHLDDDQRSVLFHLLKQPEFLFEWFIVSLIYSGLDLADIAAARFDEFEVLSWENGECYTLLVTRRARKTNQRYSAVSVTAPEFPIQKFRRVVLVPWAGEILLQRLKQLRENGISKAQIAEMRLSDQVPNGAMAGPPEIAARLQSVLKQAGIKNPGTIRTRKNGRSYKQNSPPDVTLLQRDAQYVAKRCGADIVMLHAMFGTAWSEIDEYSYVDLLSDDYAVTRYLRMRRWMPFVSDSLPEYDRGCLIGYTHTPANHLLRIKNMTDHPITLTLSALYAVKAYWRIPKGEL